MSTNNADAPTKATIKGGEQTQTVAAAEPKEPRVVTSDGFFADPKLRTTAVGVILITLSVLQLPLITETQDAFSDLKEICESLADSYGGSIYAVSVDCDVYDTQLTGLTLHLVGLIFMLVFSLLAVLMHYIVCADENKPKINMAIMVGLMLAGFFVILGHSLWQVDPLAELDNEWANWQITCIFAENFVGAITAMVLGYDVWKALLNDDWMRMLCQSVVPLAFTSLLCFMGYAALGSELESSEMQTIAAGYFFVLLPTLVKLLFEFSDVGADLAQPRTDTCIAASIVFGSLLASIGYWAVLDNAQAGSDLNAFTVGYTFLLMGLSVVTALDMNFYENAKMYWAQCQQPPPESQGGDQVPAEGPPEATK